ISGRQAGHPDAQGRLPGRRIHRPHHAQMAGSRDTDLPVWQLHGGGCLMALATSKYLIAKGDTVRAGRGHVDKDQVFITKRLISGPKSALGREVEMHLTKDDLLALLALMEA